MTQPLSAPGSPWLDDSKSKGSTPEAEEPELEPEEDEPTTKKTCECSRRVQAY